MCESEPWLAHEISQLIASLQETKNGHAEAVLALSSAFDTFVDHW